MRAPDGTTLVAVQLVSGLLNAQIVLSAADAGRFADQLKAHATGVASRPIIATVMPTLMTARGANGV